ncbi:MAG TPA: PilZ domain-containing protein [Planctomycetota bacterium]|nr:PilZ domain-containing protein [Planctomycetota bacterium]
MDDLEVLLILRGPRHEGARGRLLSAQTALEQGRVAVLFEGAELPLLALDEEIEVELFGSAMGRTLACAARVLEHRAGRGWASYVLELPDHAHSSLAGLLECRSSVRARPAVVAPVEGTLSAPDGSLAREVLVKDLSVTGAAVYLSGSEDLELLSHAGVRVSLVLPGKGAAVELRATLVWRRRAGAQIGYGLAFDAAATSDFRAARAQLAEWVARRSEGGAGHAQAG